MARIPNAQFGDDVPDVFRNNLHRTLYNSPALSDAWSTLGRAARGASQHYTPVQLVELAVLAGFYGLASRVALALDVAVDEGLTSIADLDKLG